MRKAFVVHIPTHDNNGKRFVEVEHLVNDKLLDMFGGFSNLGEITGGWVDPETQVVYIEGMLRYEIAAESVLDVFDFANWVKHEFEQESVYMRLPNGDVEFI